VKYKELAQDEKSDQSAVVRERILAARHIQYKRLESFGIFCNAQMTPRTLRRFCKLDSESEKQMENAITRLGLSARAYDRIASDISMRFHGEHHFADFPYKVRTGGMLEAFGPEMGHKVTHPQTGDVTLTCAGFNDKNDYDRETPCDQDHLRKMARKTDADRLQSWFNRDVVGIFKQHHALDSEGIFIGDGTYLFVPDNSKYEGSSRLLFDEHKHPVDSKNLTPQQRARCRWRCCYKLVSLIHTNRNGEFFLYAGIEVAADKDHGCPILYRLVEQFVAAHGKGVLKRLIPFR
jgi:hypothetical protein